MEPLTHTQADYYRQVVAWLNVLSLEHSVCPFPFSYIEFDFLTKRLAGETAYILLKSNVTTWQEQ